MPIRQPEFSWNATNLSQEFSTFKRICTSLLEDGPYSEFSGKQKVATVLNWLDTATYQLHDEFDYTGKDKDKLSDILDKFEAYFRLQHNMIHAWYRIGTIFSDTGEIKTQSDFMYRLKDLAKQCEFTNSDEVVKFLFLTHNRYSEVKQELLKHVTKDTTLIQCLEYAHGVEGNLQSVELSKYIEKVQPSTSTTDVHAVDKQKVKSKLRHSDVTPARQKTGDCESESSRCDKCGLKHKPKECPAFGKRCYRCGKDNHYTRLFHKTSKKMDETEYQSDYDDIQFDGIDT